MAAFEGATSETVTLGGLEQTLHRWDQNSDVTILFLHGFLDIGLGWSFVVDSMKSTGWNFVALDWRGHGHSSWVPSGGYYHFIDYVRDLEDCVTHLGADKLFIVGHSMGAMALTAWLGTTTQRPSGCVLLEALGPMPEQLDGGLGRVRTWLSQLKTLRASKTFPTLDVVEAKLSALYASVSGDRVRQIARWATVENEDGFTWRYDPLHRTQAPIPIPESLAVSMWESIDVPLLWVGGAKSPWRTQRLEWWLQHRPNLGRELLPDGAHMLQYEYPRAVGQSISGFIGRQIP
jgi:pimeloyl-ACP methyl ester carboxylesterase